MNKVIISGNIVREPEHRVTPQGTETCSFTLAVRRNFRKQDGTYDSDFINCVAWRQTATFIHNYFHKGSGIEIEGSLKTEVWEKDGRKNYRTFVNVESAEFGKSSRADSSSAKTDTADANQGGEEDGGFGVFIPDDSLPY